MQANVIDTNFFNSERLFGHIFTRSYSGGLMLGCFLQKGFSANGRDTIFSIDLYDIVNKLEPLAHEKIEGPTRNREWWTPDKLAGFVEVADKFGFAQSKEYWLSKPYDPVFASGSSDGANHLCDFLITNNYDSKFLDTLLETPEGERIGDYHMEGTLSFK